MKSILKIFILLYVGLSVTSCVAKKKFVALQTSLDMSKKELEVANRDLGTCGVNLNTYMAKLTTCENEKTKLRNDMTTAQASWEGQIKDLKDQRGIQQSQVGDLTNLSKSATDNIRETLAQLEKKEKYIYLLQAAKTQGDRHLVRAVRSRAWDRASAGRYQRSGASDLYHSRERLIRLSRPAG